MSYSIVMSLLISLSGGEGSVIVRGQPECEFAVFDTVNKTIEMTCVSPNSITLGGEVSSIYESMANPADRHWSIRLLAPSIDANYRSCTLGVVGYYPAGVHYQGTAHCTRDRVFYDGGEGQ